MSYDYFYNKTNEILGNDFELSWIYDNKELNDNKILKYKFINNSGIKNINKKEYIKDKIKLLKKNNILEIENLKVSGIGRFIVIKTKTIQDYESEKKILEQQYLEKLKIIDEKIKKIKKISE